MRLLYSFFLLLVVSGAFAEPYIIDFHDRKIFWYGQDEFYVENVIVTQEEKDCIGFVKRKGKEEAAYFNHAIADELMLLFGRSFQKTEHNRRVSIRINKFLLYEIEGYSFFDLNFDIYTNHDSISNIEFSTSISENQIGTGGNKHIENMLFAFEKSFREYYDRIQNSQLIKFQISNNSIYSDSLFSPLGVITPVNRQAIKGIYKTYNDFKNNNLDTKINFKEIERDNLLSIKSTRLKFPETEPEYLPWGYTDGNDYYIRLNTKENLYLQLQEGIEENYYYTRYFAPVENYGSGAMVAGILGGLAGVLIYSAAVGTEREEMILTIDQYTGKLMKGGSDEKNLLKTWLIFCHSDYSKAKKGLTFSYENNRTILLPKGSFFVCRLSPQRGITTVYISCEEGAFSSYKFNSNDLKERIYLVKMDGSGKIQLDELHDQMKMDYMRKLETMNEIK